jgi:hypothetical protein
MNDIGEQMTNSKPGKTALALIAAATAVTGLTGSAASAQSNYTRLDKAEIAACIRASGLIKATVSPTRVTFSDDVGYDVRLVSGTHPQKYMRGAQGRMMCVYRRSTGRAEAQEFLGW